MGKSESKPPLICVAMVHVGPLTPEALFGAAGGYVWIAAQAFDQADYARRIGRTLGAMNLSVLGLEMVEYASEPEALEALPVEMLAEVRAGLDGGATQGIWLGKFHVYPDGEDAHEHDADEG